jgi:hypothetical protein
VRTIRWIAASCAALLVAIMVLEAMAARMLAAGLLMLASLVCG